MYSSCKEFATMVFKMHSPDSYLANGDSNNKTLEKTGYIVESLVTIKNKNGDEIQSKTQIYTDIFDVPDLSSIEYPEGKIFEIQLVQKMPDSICPEDSVMVIYL